MKHLVFFTPSLNIGGVERIFITYAEALIRKGYKVTYLVCKKEGELIRLLPNSINLISLGEIQLRKSFFPLLRFFRNNTVDVFITGGDVPNVLSILASKIAFSKAKVIISHHNYFNVERNTLLSKLFFRYIYNKATKVLSVSDGITNMLSSEGVLTDKLVTIYNPVDLKTILEQSENATKYPLPNRYLMFLGRLGEVKNLRFLIDSFNLVNQKLPSLHLIFVGEGPMQVPLEKTVEAYGLTEKIHFLGVLPNPFPVMKKAEALILPSFSEALPTIILESFVLGKTVIATPTNGALDLLEHGKLGYLSEKFDDTVEFSNLIMKGITNPISANLLFDKVKNFDIDTKVEELEHLF